MGRLVAISTEKKKEIESPTTEAAQGKRGRLVKTGDAQQRKPFSTGKVKRASLIASTPATQQQTAQQQTDTGSEALPAERGSKHKTNRANQQRREQAKVVSNVLAERRDNTDSGYSVGKGLGGAAMKGINSAAQGIASTLAFAEDIVSAPFELLTGQNLGDFSDTAPLNRLSQRIKDEGKEIEEKYAENVERGGKGAELLDKYGSMTVAAVPQAAAAFFSGGASTAGEIAAATNGLAGTVKTAISQMAKDPQYWLAFTQAVGTGYDSALVDMEDEDNTEARTKAALFAVGNGLMNAAVEVGGGIQKLPEQLKHGAAAWKSWLDSALDEGKEEVVQGVIERALQNFTYDKGNAPVSLTDGDAVLSLPAALEEFTGGAVVGGILGAGQVGISSAANRIAEANARETALQMLMREQNTPTAALESVQERAEGTGGETTLPTAENAPTAQETDGLELLRRAAEDVSRETEQDAAPEAVTVNTRDRLRAYEDVLGESGKRAMPTAYREGTDIDDFTTEFLRAYHAGETGQSNPNGGSDVSFIAYEAGKNDAAASLAAEKRAAQFARVAGDESGLVYDDYVSTQMNSETADEINAVAKALGVRVRMADEVRGGTANGEYSGSDILLEKNNPNPVMQIVGHEWTHRVQELAPEAYRTFRNTVTNEPDVQAAAEALLDLYRSHGVDITYEGALDEATANYAGEMIANTDVLNDFIQKHSGDRTLLEKLRDALHELVQKLTGKAKKQAQTAEEMLQQAFEAAAQQAEKNSKNAASDGGEGKYSLKAFDDGTRFVDVQTEQNQFDGLDDFQKSKRATQIIKNKFIGKVIGIDNRVFVNGKTASEYGHPVKRLTSEIVNAKMRASTELDNLIDAGTNFRTRADGADGHAHPNAVGDFQYFDTIFKVGDEYYKGVINIEPVAKGLRLKDITKIENITQDLYSSYGKNPKSVFLRDASMDSIGGGSENVNGKFSLKTDSDGRQLTEAQEEYFKGSKARDAEGRLLTLYHGTGADFTVFDGGRIEQNFENRGGDLGFYFTPYAEDAKGYARNATGYTGSGKVMEVYLNLENPLIVEDSGWGDAIQQADTRHGDLKRWAKEGGHDGIIVKSTDIEMDNGEADAVYIAFSPEQIKSVTNENPTRNTDIRYSLKEYTAEEKKQHVSDAISYFGKTYRWDETGYLTPNGTKLDFSGRHEGGSGGYRTVDHRDIRDAIGDDYGGDDYSGSMVQFMSEGNIRISPESGGIDLSVAPTEAQQDALSDFISRNRGEVILDIDNENGQTVFSAEYPRGTHANKVLGDIRAYFEDGTTPQVSELAQFYTRDSLKGTEDAREVAALMRENEKLKERVEYWKGQTRRSDGVTTDKKSVEKTARALTKDYGAELDTGEITADLQSLYDYIARGSDESGELTYTEARRRADEIAARIAENAVAKDDALYQDYADLRKTLKNTRLTLSAEDVANITDYADARRGMFGKLNMAKGEHSNIDRVYSELADAYPEFFSEARDLNSADMLQRIMDVADKLYKITEYNPFKGDMGRAVASISSDIMDRFFDLPQTKKTFADRSAEQLASAKAAGKQAARDATLAGQMAQGRVDAKRLRAAQEAIARERTRRAEQLDKLRAKYREKDATRRESQKARDLRAKITRHASTLSQKLLHPTDKQHIPEELRSAVAAVLDSINTESRYETEFGTDARYHSVERGESPYAAPAKRTVAFQKLRDQCRTILAGGGDVVIDPSLLGGENVKGGFDEVIEMGNKRIDELSADELETMWKVLRAVEHSMTTAGKMLTKSKYETTSGFAQAFRDSTETRWTKPSGGMSLSLENPYTFFSHYGKAGMDMYRMLRNAQDAQELMARDVTEKVQKLLGEKKRGEGLKGRIGALRGNTVWDANAKTHEFTTERGETLTLTEAQQMEFYLLSKRKQALEHLTKGGIYQPEIRDAATGRVTTRRSTQATLLTQNDIAQIADSLTAEQKRIADGLQELTRTTLAAYGNEASMTAYGYRKFTESDYWPIRTAKEGNYSTEEKQSGNTRSIKNIGMAQQVKPGASNALDIGSVFDTFARHASDMIDYAAWLNPMEDANRVYNFKYRNGNTFKGLLDEKGGKRSQEYWKKLMGDIQNGIGSRDFEPMTEVFQRQVGSFKGSAVGANIRVVIQQPTAIFRAGAILSPADMAKGVAGGVTKGNGWEKAVAHSPIAMRKEIGGFDISSPYTLSDRFYGKQGASNKLSELATAAAGKADAVTWGALWNACEWQVKRENPDLTAGSKEFYGAVNEVFSDVIDQSQVVDGVLQRSNVMRGKTLAQQATSFMGEPIMTMNMLLRAYDNFKYTQKGPEKTAARKKFGRVATALIVTNTVNALAQSIIDGIRDDDKDKDYLERVLAAFTGIEGDEESGKDYLKNIYMNGNFAGNMSLIANVPFLKDIQSMVQGYDVARPDMETFSGLVNAGKTFIESAGGGGKKTGTDALLDLMAQGARMFGIPAANVKRDVTALLRTMATESGSIPFQYEVEKFTYNIENEGNRSRFISLLYDALEQGDYTSYEHIRDDLINSMGLNGQTISSSLKTTYDKKRAKDEDYTLSQRALDLLGIREAYAEDEENDTFGADDLNASQYTAYETQRADTYRDMEDTIKAGSMFAGYSDEVKDKALSNAAEYAKKVALRDNSGGTYEITTKWVLKAETLEKKYGISPAVYASLKAPISEVESLKDKDGETITHSKGLQIMELIYQQSGLSDKQRAALFEAFNVPESIRHYNKALVNEKLRAMRKKAK